MRDGSSYRGARRNATRKTGAVMQRSTQAKVLERPFRGSISLNRSQNRMPAKSYAHAREISPSTEPVR